MSHKSKLEYIWLDGYKPTQNLRSKTLVQRNFSGNLEDCPTWSFDGSSTQQAEGNDSDCLLKPVAIFPDPERSNGYLVMNEVLNADGTPHSSNARSTIDDDDNDFWFGFEQEYFLWDPVTNSPIGFPENGSQGQYYCSVGTENALGRDIVEEQVKSLGAKFVKIDLGETGETDQGYAKELTSEQIEKQKELQSLVCERSNIVITTAQIFGRPAPKIIDRDTIRKMKPGSVILDMAVETGGNVEGSKVDEVIDMNGVKIVCISNLSSKVSNHASFSLSNNIINWITDFYNLELGSINFDFEDEIIQNSVLVYDGEIKNERFM